MIRRVAKNLVALALTLAAIGAAQAQDAGKAPQRATQATPPIARPPTIGPAELERQSTVYVTPEQRIARLEAELARANARVADLERRFSQHGHDVPSVAVGMLSEPLNGRRVELAINPRGTKVRSGPPVQ